MTGRAASGLGWTPFEAADPAAFERYVTNDGAEARLLIDRSQLVQLGCLRARIWGTRSTRGRVVTLPG